MSRVALSMLLLVVQLMGQMHLFLSAHVMTAQGEVVDAAPACEQQGHGADGISHAHEFDEGHAECAVVAATRIAARASSGSQAVPVSLRIVAAHRESRTGASPLSVLSVAPKSSPPA